MAVETHDVGRFYFHALRVPRGTPLVQRDGVSYEVEEPWRIGRALVLRLLFLRWALVFGWWGPPRTYEEMLEAEQQDPEDAGVTVAAIREDFRPEPGHALLPEGWRVV